MLSAAPYRAADHWWTVGAGPAADQESSGGVASRPPPHAGPERARGHPVRGGHRHGLGQSAERLGFGSGWTCWRWTTPGKRPASSTACTRPCPTGSVSKA